MHQQKDSLVEQMKTCVCVCALQFTVSLYLMPKIVCNYFILLG